MCEQCAPVFRMRVEEVRLLILTVCGVLVKKSIIHEQSGVTRPGLLCLCTIFFLGDYCI